MKSLPQSSRRWTYAESCGCEDVPAAVEPERVVTQGIEDLVHLERRRDGLPHAKNPLTH